MADSHGITLRAFNRRGADPTPATTTSTMEDRNSGGPVRGQIRRATFMAQLKALLRRNIRLKLRNKRNSMQELLAPCIMVLVLVAVNLLTNTTPQPARTSFPEHDLSDFVPPADRQLVVVPNTTEVRELMEGVVQELNLTSPGFRAFSTMAEAEEAYEESGGHTLAGIEFGELDDRNFTIRMDHVKVPSTQMTAMFSGRGDCRKGDDGLDSSSCAANMYLYSYFAAIQTAVSNAFMRLATNSSSQPAPVFHVQMMPQFEYSPDSSFLQILAGIYFVMTYTPLIQFLTVSLVTEKELKIKEAMRMMGLRDSVFWLSWTIIYTITVMMIGSIITFLTWVSGLLSNSNMGYFFLLFLLYGWSVINIAFVVSTFFSKAQTAGGFATLATIMFTLLYLTVSLTRTSTGPQGPISSIPTWGQWLLSLLSPCALALAMDQAVFLDIIGKGVQTETLTWGQFPIYASMVMLLVDTVIYGLLAFYLDNVVPNEHGLRRPAWFCLMPSYWWPPSASDTSPLIQGIENQALDEIEATDYEQGGDSSNIEPVPESLRSKNVIRIRDLHKIFKKDSKTIHAVNGLSLDIYEGQITAILGHNGAGKTTTISMLTGLSRPTDGYATIYGLDVSDSVAMSEIRCMTGVCPQENVLFNTLTCREHLRFYGIIKGVPETHIAEEIRKALDDVSLLEQIDVMASALSGGQKRKLSVAIAIIGDPKIIFLDEPTAGMDPASRRHLWSLLKERQHNKVIVLTTHFMDEADILADRKAIVSRGQLKCAGSSFFLKNKFGIGYHLSMVVKSSADLDEISAVIRCYVEEAVLQRQHGKEITFILPQTSSERFGELFGELETRKEEGGPTKAEELGIKSYGVSMTTLEEVFLQLEAEEELDTEESGVQDAVESVKNSHIATSNNDVNSVSVSVSQTLADLETYQATVTGGELRSQRFWTLLHIRALLLWRTKVKLFMQFILPVIFLTVGAFLMKTTTNSGSSELTLLPITPLMYVSSNNTQSAGLPELAYNISGGNQSEAFMDVVQTLLNTEEINGSLYDSPPHNLGLHIYDISSVTQGITSEVTLQYNMTATHGIPAAINLVFNALLQMATPSAYQQPILVNSYPWKSTGSSNSGFDGGLFGATLMLGAAMSIVPSGFGITSVQDREMKARSQLRISGVSLNLYWGAAFTFDFLVYLSVATVAVSIMGAFQIPSLMQAGAILSLCCVFISVLPVLIISVYIISFMFDKVETCMRTLPPILQWAGFLPYIIISSLDMSNQGDLATIFHYIFALIDPSYCIYGGLYYIDKVNRMNILQQGQETNIPISEYFKWDSLIPICFVAPLFHACWIYFALLYLEVKSTGGDVRDICMGGKQYRGSVPEVNDDMPEDEDEIVAEERARVAEWQPGNNVTEPVTVVRNLRKEFEGGTHKEKEGCCKRGDGDVEEAETSSVKVAVRNSSFLVEPGEVFGLLGPNGAGKTTTMNVIIAETGATAGRVYVSGHDVRSSLSDAFREMGYCPQHDPLWANLTVREHIEAYAKTRGIPKQQAKDVATYFIDSLKIGEHAHKQATNCSGGTKRKLSYAISMLGLPRVVLLDEPSTGMDPKSKRFLWDTINASFEGADRGAILTTHYMEEADALCNRVGIMINGQMQCLGTTQHLKSRYGSGYSLEVKLSSSQNKSVSELNMAMKGLHAYIMEVFPDAVRTECFGERGVYKIPAHNVTSLSATFQALDKGRREHNIEDYNFSQSTLEQVFLDFAKNQVEEGGVVSGETKRLAARSRSLMRSVSSEANRKGGRDSSSVGVGDDAHA